MKKRRSQVNGSYTIEAALVFPLIMTVIVFIIYMSFFLHDRSVMSSCAYQAALKASLIRTGADDMKAEADRAAAYSIEGLLLATENVEINTSVSGKEVKVSYQGDLSIPQGILFFAIHGSDSIKVSGSAVAHEKDAIEFIRQCRSVGNAAENIFTGGRQ